MERLTFEGNFCEIARCMKCSGIGSSTDNWEWRGAPEAHNGKENS